MRLVPAGARGVDFSYARPPAQRLLELGYSFFVGYISVPPASPAKNISRAEWDTYIGAGLAGLLVWEMTPTRATLGGTYGAIDGRAAAAEAAKRGCAPGGPIIAADDCATTTTNLPAKIAYMQAFSANCYPYSMAIYGGVKILAPLAGLWMIGWVPINAWSWSVNLTQLPGETDAQYNARGRAAAKKAAHDVGAHVLQGSSFYIDNTWAVDPNEAIAPFPAWGLALEEDDMAVYLTNKNAGKYGDALQSKWVLLDEGAKRGIGYPHEYNARGEPTGRALDDETLDGIPDWAPGIVHLDPATKINLHLDGQGTVG